MSENGMIKRVGSKEYEDEAYSKYTEIRSASNPFYEDIKKLETEIQKLRLKGNKTDDDIRLIEQYRLQLDQLSMASEQWTIRDAGDNIKEIKGEQGFNFDEIGYKYTNTQDKSDNTTLNSEYSYRMGFSHKNLNINTTGSIAKEIEDNGHKIEDATTFNGTLNGEYKRENTTYSAGVTAYKSENTSTFTPQLGFGYKNFNINLSEGITATTMEMPNEAGKMSETTKTTYSTSATASYNVNKFYNNASATFTESGNTYTLSLSTNFSLISGKNVSLSVSPSLTSSYNDNNNSITLSPNVSSNLGYHKDDLNAGVTVTNSYSCTFEKGKKPEHNNTLTLSSNLAYKKLSVDVNYTNTNASYSPRHTVSGKVKYGDWGDAVNLSVEASHRSNKENSVTFGTTVNPSKIYNQNHDEKVSKVKDLSNRNSW